MQAPTDEVKMHGYVHKMGYQVTNWKKRYAVLIGVFIKYYKSEKDWKKGKSPQGVLQLRYKTEAFLADSGAICRPNSHSSSGNKSLPNNSATYVEVKDAFKTEGNSRIDRTLYFYAPSQVEQEEWVVRINAACPSITDDSTVAPDEKERIKRELEAADRKRNVEMAKETMQHDWFQVHLASAKDEVQELVRLQARGVDVVNARNDNGVTPLMQASAHGAAAAVAFLLANGAGVNDVSKYNTTALFAAARNGETAIIKTLLDHGADKSVKNSSGRTAVHYATLNSARDALLDEGEAPPEPLTYESLGDWEKEIVDKRLENLKQQGKLQKVHPRSAGLDGISETGLLIALVAQNETVADMSYVNLAGLNLSERLPGSSTALVMAAGNGKSNMALYLIEQGLDVNAQTDRGNTALHVAARSNQIESIRVLVDHGANTNLKNADGKTPFEVAFTDECKALLAPKPVVTENEEKNEEEKKEEKEGEKEGEKKEEKEGEEVSVREVKEENEEVKEEETVAETEVVVKKPRPTQPMASFDVSVLEARMKQATLGSEKQVVINELLQSDSGVTSQQAATLVKVSDQSNLKDTLIALYDRVIDPENFIDDAINTTLELQDDRSQVCDVLGIHINANGEDEQ